MEGKNLLYAPKWVRVLSIFLIIGLLIFSISGMCISLYSDNNEYTPIFLTAIQLLTPGLVFVIIAFYSNRTISTNRLSELTDNFLSILLPETLRTINIEQSDFYTFKSERPLNLGRHNTKIRIKKLSNHSRYYLLNCYGIEFLIYTSLNVFDLMMIFFIPVSSNQSVEKLENIFKKVFSISEKLGYKISYHSTRNSENSTLYYYEINVSKSYESDFLINSSLMMYCAQDVKEMVRAFALDCKRWKIDTSHTKLLEMIKIANSYEET